MKKYLILLLAFGFTYSPVFADSGILSQSVAPSTADVALYINTVVPYSGYAKQCNFYVYDRDTPHAGPLKYVVHGDYTDLSCDNFQFVSGVNEINLQNIVEDYNESGVVSDLVPNKNGYYIVTVWRDADEYEPVERFCTLSTYEGCVIGLGGDSDYTSVTSEFFQTQ